MGRFGRLLNVVAQSDDRFGGASRLGVGVDLRTGVRLIDDAQLSGVFGDSSVAIIDGETAGATFAWKGAERHAVCARNLLTHLIPSGQLHLRRGGADALRPRHGAGVPRSRAVAGRAAARPRARQAAARRRRARRPVGTGDEGVRAARRPRPAARGSSRCSPAIPAPARRTTTRSSYAQGGGRRRLDAVRRPDRLRPARAVDVGSGRRRRVCCSWAATRASLAAPVGDRAFASFVRRGDRERAGVMTDHAMTAAMGRVVCGHSRADRRHARGPGGGRLPRRLRHGAPGPWLVPGRRFEPRLTVDYRWGRLYGLARAHPDTLAFGVCSDTRDRARRVERDADRRAVGGLGRRPHRRLCHRRQRRAGGVQRAAEHLRARRQPPLRRAIRRPRRAGHALRAANAGRLQPAERSPYVDPCAE